MNISEITEKSRLVHKQFLFMHLLPALIDKAHLLGYTVSLGDGYRDPRVFGQIGESRGYGHAKSAHKQRLAIDLNLFKDGVFLADTKHHVALGKFWKELHPLCKWGGDFKNPDGNHYSIIHNGIQ